MAEESMLKFLKMKVEAATDVTITEEVAAEKEEAQADSEANAIQVVTENLQVALVQEATEATEMLRQNVKVDSEATEILQEENQVHFKEKKERQDVLKVITTDRPDVHLKLPKTEDQEEANFNYELGITNFVI